MTENSSSVVQSRAAAAPVNKQHVPEPRNGWPKKLLALTMGCIVGAFVAEAVVLLLLGPQVRFPRHVVEADWGLRYNEPGARYQHRSDEGSWTFTINTQGMRSHRDYSYDKPLRRKRIISLGDSFTLGYEVATEECFSSVLELALKQSGIDVEVLNAGVSGFSTAEECLYLERELLKYDPDVVVVSYFGNDLVDNLRTGLFKLKDGRLVEWNMRYIPGGRLANVLNRNGLFNFLSARSNAFAFFKEHATHLVKHKMVADNKKHNLEHAAAEFEGSGPVTNEQRYQRQLCGALFEQMYQLLQTKRIPLVIQSIPSELHVPKYHLVEMFPHEEFDVDRDGVAFLSGRDLLSPHVDEEDVQLYWKRSHFHWTPFSHNLSGKALAKLIMAEGYLDGE